MIVCGRYYSRRQKQQIAEHFRAGSVFEEDLAPDYNIAPSTFQPIVRLERETGGRELALLRWGLLPFFAKTPEQFKPFSTFNARTESILESLEAVSPGKKPKSSAWREPMKKRRCIVPVDGFYEWPESEKGTKGPKHPMAFSLKSGEPCALAGLWDAWREATPPGGQPKPWLQSFAIVTTEANELMARIHSRMPVILRERDWQEWLDRDDNRQPPLHLLRPYPADEMLANPCNPAVGNVRNNGPEMLNSA